MPVLAPGAWEPSQVPSPFEQAVHETLTYYGFPDIHWQKIRTNNPGERIMKEIRRRTVVDVFGRSVLSQPGGSSTAAHRRNDVVGQMLPCRQTKVRSGRRKV